MNVAFPEADLASHVLRMCPYTWQDQYNLHEKGGAPTDIRSLLQSLEAIERVCGQEGNAKSNPPRDEKPSSSEKKGTKRPGTESPRVPKKGKYQEKLQPVQEAWGRVHDTQYP